MRTKIYNNGKQPSAWNLVKDAGELGLTSLLGAILPGAGAVLFKSAVGAARTAKIAKAAKAAGDSVKAAKASAAVTKAKAVINKFPPDKVQGVYNGTMNAITSFAKQHNIPIDKIAQIVKDNPEKVKELQAGLKKAIEKEARLADKSPAVIKAAADAEKQAFKQTLKNSTKTATDTAKNTIQNRAKAYAARAMASDNAETA